MTLVEHDDLIAAGASASTPDRGEEPSGRKSCPCTCPVPPPNGASAWCHLHGASADEPYCEDHAARASTSTPDGLREAVNEIIEFLFHPGEFPENAVATEAAMRLTRAARASASTPDRDTSRPAGTVERFRAVVERTIHAQTCRAITHKPGTMTDCRFPTAEALRLLDEADAARASASTPDPLREAAQNYIDWRDRRAAQWDAVARHDHEHGMTPCAEWDALTSEPFDIDQRLDDALRAALAARASAPTTEPHGDPT